MVIAMVVESDSLTMVISSSSADANHLQGLDVLLEGHCVFQHQFVLWIGISMF